MDAFEQHLRGLCSLGVDDAFKGIERSFGSYLQRNGNLPLEAIDEWVNTRQEVYGKTWESQRLRKYPLLFLLYIYDHERYQTVRERKYQRGSLTGLPASLWEPTSAIDAFVASLSFADGAGYLGRLTGAWMLASPEPLLLNSQTLKSIRKNDPPDLEIPTRWLESVFGEGSDISSISAQELRFLFLLDYAHYYQFINYWDHNVS